MHPEHITPAHITPVHFTPAHITPAHITPAHITLAHVTPLHAVKTLLRVGASPDWTRSCSTATTSLCWSPAVRARRSDSPAYSPDRRADTVNWETNSYCEPFLSVPNTLVIKLLC